MFGRGSIKKGEELTPPQVDKPTEVATPPTSSQVNERGPSGEWEIVEPIKSSPEVAKKPPPVASKPKPGGTGSTGLTSGLEEGQQTSPRKIPGMVAAIPVNQELASKLKGVALKRATVKVRMSSYYNLSLDFIEPPPLSLSLPLFPPSFKEPTAASEDSEAGPRKTTPSPAPKPRPKPRPAKRASAGDVLDNSAPTLGTNGALL